jgi:hypothetical protein
MESLEQQLLALHMADTLNRDGGFSSAQSDTEDVMDDPLPLAKIDAREEAAPLRQRLYAGKPMGGSAEEDQEDQEKEQRLRKWIGRIAKGETKSSKSLQVRQMRGTPEEEADRARALRDWVDMKDDDGAAKREGDDNDDIALAGGSSAAMNAAPLPPDGVHIDGLWSWWKGVWSYKLHPISSEKVSHVPQVIRGGGDVTLVATDRKGTISIHPEGRGTVPHRLSAKKIQGVSDVIVYETNFEVSRSDFFKYNHDPIFVTISFPHPVTGKEKEMRLMVENGATEALLNARTWATVPDRAGDSLVLRFSRGGKNPVLRQVFILFSPSGSVNAATTSAAAAAVAASGLSEKEHQLAAHILAGTLVPLEALHDTHTIADAGAACIAIGTAASHTTAKFSHISLPPLHISHPKEPTPASRNAMALFKQYASVLANLGNVKQATGVINATMTAQERGQVLGDYICAQLAGASTEKITQVLQSLTNVSEVFYMRETHGTAQDVRQRVNKLRIAKDRSNAKLLYSQFYG